MEGPAMLRVDNQVKSAATRLERQIGTGVVVAAALSDDAGTRIAWRVEGLTLHQHELVLFDMLRGLQQETEDGAAAGCPDCVARYERVQAALAALQPCAGPGAAEPAGTC